MKSILDRTFRYTPSAETDIKKTFARVRRELARDANRSQDMTLSTVRPFRYRGKMGDHGT